MILLMYDLSKAEAVRSRPSRSDVAMRACSTLLAFLDFSDRQAALSLLRACLFFNQRPVKERSYSRIGLRAEPVAKIYLCLQELQNDPSERHDAFSATLVLAGNGPRYAIRRRRRRREH